jgi:hypothetical protein
MIASSAHAHAPVQSSAAAPVTQIVPLLKGCAGPMPILNRASGTILHAAAEPDCPGLQVEQMASSIWISGGVSSVL